MAAHIAIMTVLITAQQIALADIINQQNCDDEPHIPSGPTSINHTGSPLPTENDVDIIARLRDKIARLVVSNNMLKIRLKRHEENLD